MTMAPFKFKKLKAVFK